MRCQADRSTTQGGFTMKTQLAALVPCAAPDDCDSAAALPERPFDSRCPLRGMTISFPQWIDGLRALHEQARAGQLDGCALRAYRASRADLETALLCAQQIARDFRHSPRRSIRMAYALQIDLRLRTGRARAVTLDISRGGFSVLLQAPPESDEVIEFSLRLPGAEFVEGKARARAVVPKEGCARCSFSFEMLGAEAEELLAMFMFDAILPHLLTPIRPR